MTATARQQEGDRRHEPVPAERAAGQSRLDDFLRQGARYYASRRNYDFGPDNRNNVSGLSPYIRHRLLLDEDVLAAVLERFSLAESEKFVQEVFWRAYFKGWLEHRPSVWFAYRQQVQAAVGKLDEDSQLCSRLESALTGTTGIECFDAWSQELIATGYLHNHARMWFASIWTFTLELPWQLGADFFLRHLLDGDAASNTLGWRWVAGLHTRGKTYLARPSNIRKYTDGRFSPGVGELATEAFAIGEPDLPSPIDIDPGDEITADTSFGLLITDEDCSAESLDIPRAPSAVIGLTAASARSPLEVAGGPRQFAADAVRDALQRFQSAYGVTGDLHEGGEWTQALTDWATENDLRFIVTAAPTQGPVNDLLALAERELMQQNIRVLRLRRGYDTRAWPYATKGFFRLRKEIPSLLKALDLGRRW